MPSWTKAWPSWRHGVLLTSRTSSGIKSGRMAAPMVAAASSISGTSKSLYSGCAAKTPGRVRLDHILSFSRAERGAAGKFGATSPTLITARIGQPIRTTARPVSPPNKRLIFKLCHYRRPPRVFSRSRRPPRATCPLSPFAPEPGERHLGPIFRPAIIQHGLAAS
jgi:hypothetical protein